MYESVYANGFCVCPVFSIDVCLFVCPSMIVPACMYGHRAILAFGQYATIASNHHYAYVVVCIYACVLIVVCVDVYVCLYVCIVYVYLNV